MEFRDQDRLFHVDDVIRGVATPPTLLNPSEVISLIGGDASRSSAPDTFRTLSTPGVTITREDTPDPADTDPDARTMVGYPVVYDAWTEIESFWEGTFLERIDPAAANKTIADKGSRIVPFFDHGFDPEIGYKPIGTTLSLTPDEEGLWAEAALLRADIYQPVDAIVELIRTGGLFGQSFRFRVLHDEWMDEPDPSEVNPRGIPERTIREMEMFEYGPVTWPAYSATTVGLRDSGGDLMEPVRTRQEFDLWRQVRGAQWADITDEIVTPARSRLTPAQRWAVRQSLDTERTAV